MIDKSNNEWAFQPYIPVCGFCKRRLPDGWPMHYLPDDQRGMCLDCALNHVRTLAKGEEECQTSTS